MAELKFGDYSSITLVCGHENSGVLLARGSQIIKCRQYNCTDQTQITIEAEWGKNKIKTRDYWIIQGVYRYGSIGVAIIAFIIGLLIGRNI